MTKQASYTIYDQYRAFTSRLIRHHEGVRTHPYVDTVGKLTIGVGRNLTDRGLGVDEINLLFETDFDIAHRYFGYVVAQWRHYSVKQQSALTSCL